MTKANVVIPKPIQWNQITLPEEWILESATELVSQIREKTPPNTEIKQITQFQDGRVKISFDRTTSNARFSDTSSSESLDLGRVSQIPSVINLPYKEQPQHRPIILPYPDQADLHPHIPPVMIPPYTPARFSTSDLPNMSLRNIDHSNNIAQPIYTEPQQEIKSPSPPASPKASALTENIAHELSVIDKKFVPDKASLHKDFYASHNLEKRAWFFEHFLNTRQDIQIKFYDFLQNNKVNLYFFDWFEIYTSENDISYPFKDLNPVTIRKKNWELANGQSIESEHPPLRMIKIPVGEDTIDAAPYKKPQDNDSQNLKNIVS